MHARRSNQLQGREHGDGFCAGGHTGQTQPSGNRTAAGHALAQPWVLGAQPHAVAKGRRVLHGPVQDQGVLDRHLGLRKPHASGIVQLRHLGQGFALESARQRPKGEQAAAAEFARPQLEHLHQTGLIQRGLGIGQAHHTGDATCGGGGQLRLQHAFVLIPGLAQSGGQINQARRHDHVTGIEDAVGLKVRADLTNDRDAPTSDGQIRHLIATGCRIHDAAVFDQDPHFAFAPCDCRLTHTPASIVHTITVTPHCQPGSTSPPCARQCQSAPAARSRFAGHRPRWSQSPPPD